MRAMLLRIVTTVEFFWSKSRRDCTKAMLRCRAEVTTNFTRLFEKIKPFLAKHLSGLGKLCGVVVESVCSVVFFESQTNQRIGAEQVFSAPTATK